VDLGGELAVAFRGGSKCLGGRDHAGCQQMRDKNVEPFETVTEPRLAGGHTLVILFGALFLSERLTWAKGAGGLLIVAEAIIIALE